MTIAVLKKLCSTIPWCDPAVLEQTVELALEIAREGREGRRIGTLFTLGNAEAVLAASRPLILDPLAAHAPARTHITDPNLRGTIKELAQLDGAFVISDTGTVVAACRYLDASVEQIDLPLGLGSRHLAAASISQRLGTIAIETPNQYLTIRVKLPVGSLAAIKDLKPGQWLTVTSHHRPWTR